MKVENQNPIENKAKVDLKVISLISVFVKEEK